jgi:hypothetical protein
MKGYPFIRLDSRLSATERHRRNTYKTSKSFQPPAGQPRLFLASRWAPQGLPFEPLEIRKFRAGLGAGSTAVLFPVFCQRRGKNAAVKRCAGGVVNRAPQSGCYPGRLNMTLADEEDHVNFSKHVTLLRLVTYRCRAYLC